MNSRTNGWIDERKACGRMQKRRYEKVSWLARDLRGVVRDLRRLRTLKGGELVDSAFRERLMLAVTQVNECRYCAYAHARMALSAGLADADVLALLAGELKGVPEDQMSAVLYAQHWAETDGQPDPEIRGRVLGRYGSARTEAMEAYMRMMRVGNLAGNSWDHLLGKVSRRRRG